MHPALPVIAQIARTDAAGLAPETVLGTIGLNSSLGLGILRGALERKFGRRLGRLSLRMTIGQLLAEVDGAAPAADAMAAAPCGVAAGRPALASGPFGGRSRRVPTGPGPMVGHGIDLQEIAALPAAAGSGLADPFYPGHFTEAELANAGSRPDAREHLCGLWSAKEAIRKSHPELAALDWKEIEIGHDPAGRPQARLRRGDYEDRFSVVLSISHSSAYAVASAIVFRR